MGKYRKLTVAVVGLGLIVLNQFFGVQIGIDAQAIVTFVAPMLTALGVFAVPNETA